MKRYKPERLNLAIGENCFVHCEGCYTFFGGVQPDLEALRKTTANFVKLGIDKVTISGGDPMTILGITDFLVDIRGYGIKLIKLDTVGTNLVNTHADGSEERYPNPAQRLKMLVEVVDYVGIPLDGWSNDIVQLFRAGRKFLYDETIRLLYDIDQLNRTPNVVINTVIHAGNYTGLHLILEEIARHRSICHWNVFQYTPTDQVPSSINDRYKIDFPIYEGVCKSILSHMAVVEWAGERPSVEFRTIESRLGEYLLINSNGDAWLPDENGNTIRLGKVYGQEEKILQDWSEKAQYFQTLRQKDDLSELLSSE